ncbi:MAG: hypothetical protein WEA08_06560, partial [Woeseia sp.]
RYTPAIWGAPNCWTGWEARAMRRRALTAFALTLLAGPAVAGSDDEPLPMRTEQAIVYATPIKNTVILEFKLYDNRTWCWLYLKKATWDAIRANGGELPEHLGIGQLQCERR